MKYIFAPRLEEDGSEWLSVSDLMAGLMVIFLFIAIVFIRPLAEQNKRMSDIALTWQEREAAIYEALLAEFQDDLPRWNAEIERDTLLIRFKSPDVLFETGQDDIRNEFRTILADFFPRYIGVLSPFKGYVEELRIEGHTSSEWLGSDRMIAYFNNMELSQNRTRAVLRYVLELKDIVDEQDWLKSRLTANGLSSSQLVLLPDGQEDSGRSRRVEFRVRTTARAEIIKILEAVQ